MEVEHRQQRGDGIGVGRRRGIRLWGVGHGILRLIGRRQAGRLVV